MAMVLLALLIAVCIHERYIQRAYKRLFVPPPPAYTYNTNTHFHEEADFNTLYHSRPAIVMFGNSLVKKMNWDELLGREDVVNRGVHVDLTDGMVARVDAAIALRPKIIFIEGGINDIDMGVSRSRTLANYRLMLQRIKAANIVPVLNAVNHVAAFYPEASSANDSIRAVNLDLQMLAKQSSTPIIDLNPVIAPDGFLRKEFARGDGCHLTSKAYRIWKTEVLRVLAENGL